MRSRDAGGFEGSGASCKASAAIIALVTSLTWPVTSIRPRAGIDWSWTFALHRGAELGLRWGQDVVFTYGPLGFLTQPVLWSTPTAALSLAWVALQWGALAATLFSLLRRFLSTPLTALGTWVLLAVIQLPMAEATAVLVCLWCVAIIQGIFAPRQQGLLLRAAAVLAGVDLLVKFNTGIACVAMVMISTWAVRTNWRSVTKTAGLTAAALLVAWVASSRSIWGLGPFLHRSVDVAAGYTEAMWTGDAPIIGYPLFFVLTAGLCLLVALQGRPGKRLALFALVAVVLFFFGKASFVRYDPGHASVVFTLLALVPLAFGLPRTRRVQRLALCIMAVSGASMFLVATYSGIQGFRLWPSLVRRPTASVHALDEMRTVLTSRRFDLQAAARPEILDRLGLNDLPRGILDDQSVHVDPNEASAAWALQVRWRPVPVFQSYSAYTPSLDDMNARTLASAQGPQRILRVARSHTVNVRNPAWESPAFMLAMLCHYRQQAAGTGWQVLEKIPNRCGPARRLPGADAVGRGPVPIPAGGDNELVFARVGLQPSLREQIATILFRPLSLMVVYLNSTERYRLVPATAGQPLLLRIPPAWGYSPDFRPSLSKQTMDLRGAGQASVEFWAVPLTGAPAR